MSVKDEILGKKTSPEVVQNIGEAGSGPMVDWEKTAKEVQPEPFISKFEKEKAEEKRRQEAVVRVDMPEQAVNADESAIGVADTTPKRLSYEEMYKRLNPYKPPTEEEAESFRKKEKREKLFSSISDGISALSNLYFTTKGAPNMFDYKNAAFPSVESKWERLRHERKAQMDAYVKGLMQAKQADDEWDYRLGVDAFNRGVKGRELEFKINKDKRDAALHEVELLLMEGKISEQTARARKAKIDADYAEKIHQSEINKNNAATENSRASAGSKNQFVAYDANGNAYYFSSAAAANYFAQQQGTFVPTEVTTTTTTNGGPTMRGGTTTKGTSRKSSGGYSAKPTSGKKSNPMTGGNGSKKKKNPMS